MRILFRTGGGRAKKKELGLGHVIRSINLANSLKPHYIHFLIEDYGGVKKILRTNGYKKITNLQTGISTEKDIEKTINCIEKEKIGLIIIDKYKVNKQYVKLIRNEIRTVVISDLKKIDYDADLIINGFIGFKNMIRKNRFGSRCLLGPSFQILSKNFSSYKKFHPKKVEMLATFGGFDEQNISTVLIKTLEDVSPKLKTKIILGPSSKRTKELNSLAKKNRKWLKIENNTNNMYQEISKAEFGICSGGLTTYEFACCNIKFGIICQNNHQMLTAREWQKKGIATNLGLINFNTSCAIKKFVSNLMEDKKLVNQNKHHLVDNLGTQRVKKEILNLAKLRRN